ncbi:MAG: type IX secretion system membrane protein PorP/SprF [Tunicatimonas sp.]
MMKETTSPPRPRVRRANPAPVDRLNAEIRFATLVAIATGRKVLRGATGLLLCLLTFSVQAQQHMMFTQYMFNGLAINPAYAGSQGGLDLTALAREQWVGLEGAPSTQTFAAHAPLRNKKVALGLLMTHDRIGVTDQTGLYGVYAYRIKLKHGTLSAGLQVGFDSYRTGFSRVRTEADGDRHFSVDNVRALLPNVGTGVYYATQRFYAGVSVPQLLNNAYPGHEQSQARQFRHWFASAGYVIDLNRDLKLKPNVLLKAVQGAPASVDLNANLLIKETLWVGASYRSFDALSWLVELQASPKLRIGYAYDMTVSPLRQVNSGSHELMLNYRVSLHKSKVITPRYF